MWILCFLQPREKTDQQQRSSWWILILIQIVRKTKDFLVSPQTDEWSHWQSCCIQAEIHEHNRNEPITELMSHDKRHCPSSVCPLQKLREDGVSVEVFKMINDYLSRPFIYVAKTCGWGQLRVSEPTTVRNNQSESSTLCVNWKVDCFRTDG